MRAFKMTLFVAIGCSLGVVYCLLAIHVFNTTSSLPVFPSPGGESDFDSRIEWFLFAVLPAFALIGAWIGAKAFQDLAALGFAVLGVLLATLIYCAVIFAMSVRIEQLPGTSANFWAIVTMLALPACVLFGAIAGVRANSRHPTD